MKRFYEVELHTKQFKQRDGNLQAVHLLWEDFHYYVCKQFGIA